MKRLSNTNWQPGARVAAVVATVLFIGLGFGLSAQGADTQAGTGAPPSKEETPNERDEEEGPVGETAEGSKQKESQEIDGKQEIRSLALPAPAQSGEPSPLSGRGMRSVVNPYTEEDLAELNELEATVQTFEQNASEYREATRNLIEYKFKQKRDSLFNSYEKLILKLEDEQRQRRDTAISRFEAFLKRYPEDPKYTPDAMFRLSELYFERSYDVYFHARQLFDKAIDLWDPDGEEAEPTEPSFHYEPTIAMMQRLIVEFPKYRLVDGAYYLLGYCLGEQGEDERAVDVYQELVARAPASKFGPEVWTRIGEYYFDNNELERALNAYSQVLGSVESPFYDKALYKLAWTHYRLADPERAPEEFQYAVDTFVELLDFNERTKAAGKERGQDLRKESIQYIAISYADEQWGTTEKAIQYIDQKPGRPYERELIVALGDVYFDQTRFDAAIEAYNIAQQRFGSHPEAPQVQEQIVQAHERNRNFEGAADARTFMTTNYEEGSEWFEKNKGDKDATEAAQRLLEKSLYAAALFHHKQAQIHRESEKIDLAQAEYAKAADAYGRYLKRFPHDKQLYDLTFYYAESLYYSLRLEEAATAYEKVRDSNASTKFQRDSAFSAVLAYENSIKVAEGEGRLAPVKVLTSTERPEGADTVPKEIPDLRQRFIHASDRFSELIPEDESTPKVLYKAAEVFFTFDHFEEARKRFSYILEHYPADEVTQFASNLTIESYLLEKNFPAVEAFSRRLLEGGGGEGAGEEGGPRDKFLKDLVKFKTGAMFKLADDLAASAEYEKAAELYLKILDEHAEAEFADSALNNAAVAYEKVSRFDSASKLYERLVAGYPESPLADSALFRVGLNAERFFDFDKAIGAYSKLVKSYPKSERRADAIYNGALSLENTQLYERSAKEYLSYCRLFPTRDDAPAVCFRAGAVYEKMGDFRRVISTYRNFIKKYRRNADHRDRIIEAHLKIAKAYVKLGKARDASRAYQDAVREYSRDKDVKSAPYAAEAQFQIVEQKFTAFRKLKIEGTSKQQKKALTKKAEELKKVEDAYKEILAFKQIDWTLASLFRIGQLYQEFAERLLTAPCPGDIKKLARRGGFTPEEICDEYRIVLEERSVNIEDKAVLAFETTISRARELQVVNKWTKSTLVQLNKLRRSEWPLQKDAKSFVDAIAVAPPTLRNTEGGLAAESPKPEPTPAPGDTPVPAAGTVPPPAAPPAPPVSPAAAPSAPTPQPSGIADPADTGAEPKEAKPKGEAPTQAPKKDGDAEAPAVAPPPPPPSGPQ